MKEYVEKLKRYTKNLSVLYVEDDMVIQEQTHDFLSRFFDKITLAQNGAMGLETYKNGTYDLVISDINMPEMNGIDMCRQIRESNEEQPVIITSAYNDTEYFVALIDVGVDKFVMKPFDNAHFLKVLSSITKSIYMRKQESQFEEELKKRVTEMKTILNLMNEAICVIDENKIVEANKRFVLLMGFKDRKTIIENNFQLPVLFDKQVGYLEAKDNEEMISKLKESGFEKVMLNVGGAIRAHLIRLAQVEQSNKYVITLVDVNEMESQLEVDELTKLPSRNYLYKKMNERRRQKQAFHLMLFSVKNTEQIIKWHGVNALTEVEKQIGRILPLNLKELPENVRPEVAYMGSNKFVFLINDKAKAVAFEQLEKLNQLTSRIDSDKKNENASISIQVSHMLLDAKEFSLDEIVKAMKQGYAKLSF